MPGLPDTATLASFDGEAKQNYQALPPSNDITDWDNTLLAQAISDVAALGLVSPRVVLTMTLAATTGALVINSFFAVWSNVTSTSPIAVRTTTGVFTITLPTTVSDEYSASLGNTNTHTTSLKCPIGACFTTTTPGFVNVSCSGNVITIHTFNASGSANDMVGSQISVSVR